MQHADRRDFLKLAGLAGVTFTAGLFPGRQAAAQATDFHFVQFSDTHLGPIAARPIPTPRHTLEKAVATVNGLAKQPDSSSSPAISPTRPTETPRSGRARMKRFR